MIPEQASYLIDLEIFKELEDLPRPLMSTAGAATFNTSAADDRGTQPLPSFTQADPLRSGPRPINWIPQGRDMNLEQVMLAKIQARLAVAVAPPAFAAPAFGPTPGPEVIPRP